jgi:hypothetical protein
MSRNQEHVESRDIGFEQAKAILKIAYLLSAMDGTICDREQAQFRELMKLLFGERYADPEVMTFLEGVSEDARKLIALRAFYSGDEEIVKAFAAKAAPLVSGVASSSYVVRSAFAIWIGICCADNDYSKIERLAVKELQGLFNANSCRELIGLDGIVVGMPIVSPTFALASNVSKNVAKMLKAGLAKNAPRIAVVTDKFLADVEKRVKKIGEIYAKMEAATGADMKQNYKDMYDFEVANLREYIASR